MALKGHESKVFTRPCPLKGKVVIKSVNLKSADR